MDLASDSSHLYDDSKFGDVCTKLDIKNRLDTKHQNIRASRNYELTAKTLDKSSSIIARDHEREIKLIKNGLQDIYVKTPYFNTFWKIDQSRNVGYEVGDSVKEAVVNRILRRSRKRHEMVGTVPENDILEFTNRDNTGTFDKRSSVSVRRSKSEPLFHGSMSVVEQTVNKRQRLRSESLSHVQLDKSDKTMISNISSVSCLFPAITDANNTNRDLTRYNPIAFPKPLPKKMKRSVSVPDLGDSQVKPKTQLYVKKANYHTKALDNIYFKRLKPIPVKNTSEQVGLEFDDLPENPTLRAHFISQANSRRLSLKTTAERETDVKKSIPSEDTSEQRGAQFDKTIIHKETIEQRGTEYDKTIPHKDISEEKQIDFEETPSLRAPFISQAINKSSSLQITPERENDATKSIPPKDKNKHTGIEFDKEN